MMFSLCVKHVVRWWVWRDLVTVDLMMCVGNDVFSLWEACCQVVSVTWVGHCWSDDVCWQWCFLSVWSTLSGGECYVTWSLLIWWCVLAMMFSLCEKHIVRWWVWRDLVTVDLMMCIGNDVFSLCDLVFLWAEPGGICRWPGLFVSWAWWDLPLTWSFIGTPTRRCSASLSLV